MKIQTVTHMAIWQYSFLVIPKIAFDKGDLKSYFEKDGSLDDETCWLIKPIKTDFFNEIEKILPKNESWSNKILLFGNEDSNRFEVYKNESGNVISVSFRIDYTSLYEDVLRSVIDFISMNGLVILNEELEVVENNFTTMRSIIDNSSQRGVYKKLKNKEEE